METVPRAKAKGSRSPDVLRVASIVQEYDAVEIVVGLPRTLRGERGSAVDAAAGFARALAKQVPGIPIRMADERLTTVTATRALRESGVRAKSQRGVIDQAAAVAILQGWLDERSSHLAAQKNLAEQGHIPEVGE